MKTDIISELILLTHGKGTNGVGLLVDNVLSYYYKHPAVLVEKKDVKALKKYYKTVFRNEVFEAESIYRANALDTYQSSIYGDLADSDECFYVICQYLKDKKFNKELGALLEWLDKYNKTTRKELFRSF